MEHFKTTRMITLKNEDVKTLDSCLALLYALDEELAEFLDEQEDSVIRLLKDEAWKSYATLYDFLDDCKHFKKEVK